MKIRNSLELPSKKVLLGVISLKMPTTSQSFSFNHEAEQIVDAPEQ